MPSMNIPHFEIISAEWESDSDRLLAVRRPVFVEEQGVPEEIEVDKFDPVSFHVLAIESSSRRPIGTARLLPDGRIGRVAVLKEWRKCGVGMALMNALLVKCKTDEYREVTLNAQVWTLGFYQNIGFVCEGDEFDEAGIPHRAMRLTLT